MTYLQFYSKWESELNGTGSLILSTVDHTSPYSHHVASPEYLRSWTSAGVWVWVCARTHARACTHMYTGARMPSTGEYVYMQVEVQEQSLMLFRRSDHLCFLRQGLSLAWNSPCGLGWLARESQEPPWSTSLGL